MRGLVGLRNGAHNYNVFLLSKNTKYDVTRCGFRMPKCSKMRFWPLSALDSAGKLTTLPQTFDGIGKKKKKRKEEKNYKTKD